MHMDSGAQGRIGIFQAAWPLQSHTLNFAAALADAGYGVDLFLHETTDFADLETRLEDTRVVVHLLSKADKGLATVWQTNADKARGSADWKNRRMLGRVIRKAVHLVRALRERVYLWLKAEQGLIPARALREARRVTDGKAYLCLIGVEKSGLIWAGRIAKERKIPLLYYSLELYTRDHPEAWRTVRNRRIKEFEARYHRQTCATVVQDRRRAAVLLDDNRVERSEVICLPVSLPGPPHLGPRDFLREMYPELHGQHVVLQLGIIAERRWSVSLAEAAQHLAPGWTMVMHGWGEIATMRCIAETDVHRRVFISSSRLPAADLRQLARSAEVGLVLYRAFPLNDYLTAFSSEKLALYLQCGVPVIAFRYPGYELLEREGCGVLIDSVHEVPLAVERIMSAHMEFSQNAVQCFTKHYEFQRNFEGVLRYVEGLGSKR
jgi:glycosyltransferase involved in cell wall biosynthesis